MVRCGIRVLIRLKGVNKFVHCASASAGEGRSPVLSPGSVEPEREAGPAAMGHPSWGSRHGLYDVDVGGGERPPADARGRLLTDIINTY